MTGQAFTVVTSEPAGGGATYHIRCLPTDFPTWSAKRDGAPQSAFYVTTPTTSLTGGSSPYVAVFDTNGVPVWWASSAPQPIDAKILPGGNVAWAHFPPQGPYGFEEHKLDGTPIRLIDAIGSSHGVP